MLASRGVRWTSFSLACAAIAALEPGCGADVDRTEPSAEAAALVPAAAGCTAVAASGIWWNQAFPEQAKRFHAEFDVTPSASSIDAVVGLSDGSASDFSQLAAIVRFNPAGTIDVRAGSTYKADANWPYQAGETYHLRFDVDPRTGSYSVWIRFSTVSYLALASSYPFRTEQAGVTRLSNVASEVDSPTGTLDVCGFTVVADATTADGCVIAVAGDGFASVALPDATMLDAVSFNARPSAQNIDAVFGLSSGAASSYSDLATAVRFAPSGVIDVRDGDIYRADEARPYDTRSAEFRVIADLTTHTYSAFERGLGDAHEIARQYKVRTEQSAVRDLDHLDVIVDGTQGSVTVCDVRGDTSAGVAFSREGNYAVLPLANDEALLSDRTTTARVDASGNVLATVARAGELATDVLGNVFIASVDGNTLAVDKYDPSFTPRWHATATVLAGAAVNAMSTDPTGAVLIGVVTPQDTSLSVFSFTAGGALASQLSASGDAVTIDGDQPIVAWNDGPALRIIRFAVTGQIVWSREFAGNARITAMTVDPSHDVLLGGELISSIDFGGGTLQTRSNSDAGPINGFLVKLSSAGAHVFSMKTGYSEVGGIAASDARVVVSGTEHTQLRYEHLQSFGPDGTPEGGRAFSTGLGEHGFGRRVTMGPSGRVWWNLETQWPAIPAWPYLVVVP